MARALIIITILIALVGGWMFFSGGSADSVEPGESLEETQPTETAEAQKPSMKPLEEFFPREINDVRLVSSNYMVVSEEVSTFTAGYEGGFDFSLSNCTSEATAEEVQATWELRHRRDGDPTTVFINDLPANQFVDEDLAPKAYSWRDGTFVFSIVRYQDDPDGNLLKIAEAIATH